MKKVGTLTFHDAHNYGAVLQAYALKKYLNKLDGIEAKVINYHHHTIPNGFPKKRGFKGKNIKEISKMIYSHRDHISRWNKFDSFIKELIENEEEVHTSEEALEKLDLDYWICGSDQIWNTDISIGFNRGFFLDFETKGKKISYAASMGIPKLDKEYEPKFIEAISKLDYLSVREETLKNYIESLCDKEVVKTVDPTLLLEKADYEEILEENKIKDKYILIYALIPDERLTKAAKEMAQQRNLKIVELNDFKKSNYFCEQVSDAGPKDFITLIRNAEAIITNSFHGTIFSIIFEKEFYTFTSLNRNSRMENILSIVDMRDRLLENVESMKNVKEQDYVKAKKNLNEEIEKSKSFLKKALDVEE